MGCNCGATVVEKLEPEGSVHYARFVCSECGGFMGFKPKPKNEGKRRDHNDKWGKMHKERGYVCGICGATGEDFSNSGQWQCDHIIQLEAGGKDEFENTMMLCTFCHTIKNTEQARRAALRRCNCE